MIHLREPEEEPDELNELLEWVRLPLIIATTPRLSRYLRGKPEEASKVKAK